MKRWLIPGLLLIAALGLLATGTQGTLTIRAQTQDAPTIEVGGLKLDRVREAEVRLRPGRQIVRVSQADYEPLTRAVWVAPWSHRTLTLTPRLTAEGRRRHDVRAAGVTFVEAVGTYDAKNFDPYLAKLRTLSLPEVYDSVFASPAYSRGRAYDTSIETRARSSAYEETIKSLSGDRAVVEMKAAIRETSTEGAITVRKHYTVALVRQGSAWQVSEYREEYI